MSTFGFIGTGNMGGALARAAARVLNAEDMILSNRTAEKAEKLAAELGCRAADSKTAAAESTFVFLGVKPQMMGELLAELSPVFAARKDRFVLVTMAAGLTMENIRTMAGGNYPVIRIMPNTPVSVGEGVILYDKLDVTEAELSAFSRGLSAAGMVDFLREDLIDAGCAVTGCGPAFADLFMEALADAGTASGLPRDKALLYAASMVKGAAALMLETGKDPKDLREAVCSPGGATIEGVKVLESRDFRGAVHAAVDAALKRSKELRK